MSLMMSSDQELEETLMALDDDLSTVQYVLFEVSDECERQDEKWGDQSHHPDGTGAQFKVIADAMRKNCDERDAAGELSWTDILSEEFYEALSETDPEKLRTELVQVAAVCAQWVAAIDKRSAQ
jgi:hypothetical protein